MNRLYVNIIPHASRFKSLSWRRVYIVAVFPFAMIENIWNTVVGTFDGASTWWNFEITEENNDHE